VGHGVVLVVDDEESVRTVLSRVLARAGYKVLSAADGQEALIIFAREVERISAVVLDLTMPRLDGIEVMRLLRRLSPDVRVLLMSGYSDDEVKARFAGEHVAGFLQKPFQNKELVARLAALLRA
ncbi:MAG TPA: response regulator, partial [Gemmatimonadaceae bacterium]|nr:response regulator [Gemmatimonadaceae bacterium]